jgi:hypothetical protein
MYVYKVAEVNAIKSTGIWADNGVEMEDNDIAFEEDVDIATI